MLLSIYVESKGCIEPGLMPSASTWKAKAALNLIKLFSSLLGRVLVALSVLPIASFLAESATTGLGVLFVRLSPFEKSNLLSSLTERA